MSSVLWVRCKVLLAPMNFKMPMHTRNTYQCMTKMRQCPLSNQSLFCVLRLNEGFDMIGLIARLVGVFIKLIEHFVTHVLAECDIGV